MLFLSLNSSLTTRTGAHMAFSNLFHRYNLCNNYQLSENAANYIYNDGDNEQYIKKLANPINKPPNHNAKKEFTRCYVKCARNWFAIDYLLHRENNNKNKKK